MTAIAKLEKDFSENVMGYSAIGIIVSTCIGAFAIMGTLSYGTGAWQMLLVFLSVSICSLHNAAILTVQKPQLIFKLFMISCIFNSVVVAITALASL